MKDRDLFQLALAVPIVAAVSRSIYSSLTGFILPDEALYYYAAHGFFETGEFVLRYQSRVFFQSLLTVISVGLNLRLIWDFMIALPLLSAFASGVSMIYFLRIMRKIGVDQRVSVLVSVSLLSSLSFMALSALILTEALALMFVVMGVFYAVKPLGLKDNAKTVFCFILATLIREPYFLFYAANVAYLIWRSRDFKTAVFVSLPLSALGWIVFAQYFAVSIPYENLILYPSYGVVSIEERAVSFLANLSLGAVIGFGLPILFILHGFFREKNRFLVFQASVALGIYGLVVLEQSQYSFYASLGGLSAMVRFSHMALPSFLLLRSVFARYGHKILFLFVFSLALTSSLGSLAAQRGVLSDGIYPWMKAASFFHGRNSSIAVVAEPTIRLSLFVDSGHVSVYPPVSEAVFKDEIASKKFDSVYVYGEKHVNHIPALQANAGWHLKLVENKTSFLIRSVWDDADSYLYLVEIDE